ncbi:MAG TPA: hypothetical protein VFT75_11010 [Nocardioidaceae bacterium]|nr:hypothetical protein [Nocardioidaceae bacterium]
MNTRRRVAAVVAAMATAVTGTALVPSQVDAVGKIPTIRATMTNQAIHLSRDTVRAGRIKFRVVVPSGDHELQVLQLHKGYRPRDLMSDIGKAFRGRIPAIKRVDTRVTWLGGAEAKKNHPGRFAITLPAGRYFIVDQNGPAAALLTVTGTTASRAWIRNSSTIVGTGNDRFRAPKVIPAEGWTVFRDTSDEPHFLVMQQVKRGTTRHMVKRYFASGDQAEPPFALPAGTSSGVISGGTQMLFHYNLPAGRYVLMCFWPSDETGMPHATMGMFRMINLR